MPLPKLGVIQFVLSHWRFLGSAAIGIAVVAGALFALWRSYDLGYDRAHAAVTAKWTIKMNEARAENLRLAAEARALEARAKEVTVKTVYRYVDRIKVVSGDISKIVERIPAELPQEAVEQCVIPQQFIDIHNDAVSKFNLGARQ